MISLVTATLNSAATLRSCLESLAAQTVPFEHIVIDGGSTDSTLAIVDEYRERIAAVVSEPDFGLYDALNKGIAKATGDIIGILHSDDFYPTADILASVAEVFEDPAVDACYGDLLYVKEGKAKQPGRFKSFRYWRAGAYEMQNFYKGWMPPHPTLFVRRHCYEEYGYFRLDFGTAADYEMTLRLLLRHRLHVRYLPKILVCMRTGGASNRSLSARFKAHRMDRRAWATNGLKPAPWTLWLKPLRKLPQWWLRP